MNDFLNSVGYGQWILHALVIIPLVGVLLLLAVPERLARHVALGITLVEAIVSLGLWWHFDPAAGMQYHTTGPWLPRWGISYRVGLDGISLFMVLLTTVLGPLSVLGSYRYITQRERGYYALLVALLAGLVGCFIALDLFVFYVFFELMLIPMYFIIGIWGGKNRIYAAIKFFIYTMFGSLLMLVAILVLVWRCRRPPACSPSAMPTCSPMPGPWGRWHRGSLPRLRSRLPSRSRSSRSIPGCPTPTWRRRRRDRSSWPA